MVSYAFENERLEAADDCFECWEFDSQVEDSNGWDFITGGDRYRKIVFLENPEGGDSIKTTFVVEFQPESDIVENIYEE